MSVVLFSGHFLLWNCDQLLSVLCSMVFVHPSPQASALDSSEMTCTIYSSFPCILLYPTWTLDATASNVSSSANCQLIIARPHPSSTSLRCLVFWCALFSSRISHFRLVFLYSSRYCLLCSLSAFKPDCYSPLNVSY